MLLALAAFEEGKGALAFPHFGAERMGAPMNAFVRISSQPIRIRSQVLNPDYILVLDPSLLQSFDVIKGLKSNGAIIINSPLPPSQLQLPTPAKVITVDASQIAQQVLGRADRANTAILGAFATLEEVSIDALKKAVKSRFPGEIGEKNAQAMQQAFDMVKGQG
jgi:pyruvate ferredoxin oxidoreductase gamma subunit